MKILLRDFFKYKVRIVMLVVIGVLIALTAVCTFLVPISIQSLTNDIASGKSFRREGIQIGIVCGLSLLIPLFDFLIEIIRTKISSSFQIVIIEQYFKNLISQDAYFFEKNQSSELAEQLKYDSKKIASIFSRENCNLLTDVFVLISSLLGIMRINWWYVLLLPVILLARSISIEPFSKRIKSETESYIDQTKSAFGKIESVLGAAITVKLSQYDVFKKAIYDLQADVVERERKLEMLDAGNALTGQLMSFCSVVSFILISVATDDNFSLGTLVATLTYIGFLFDAISNLANYRVILSGIRPSLDRLNYLSPSSSNDNIYENSSKITSISLRNISIHSPNFNQTFSGNLVLRTGSLLFLVGPNGSGKTTILKSLTSLFPSSADRIIINGQELNNLDDYRCYLKHIAFSLQTADYIEDSLEANISLFVNDTSQQITLEELSCKNRSILEKWFSDLQELSCISIKNWSGGQRQKLSLLRTILSDRDVLLFDEPTSYLDWQTAEEFVSLVKELESFHIVVIVTHDPNLLNISHREYVVEGDK